MKSFFTWALCALSLSAAAQPANDATVPLQITAAGNIYGATSESLPPVANVFSFIGPTVNLNLTANQRVMMNVTTSLGRYNPGFATFIYDIGFRPAGSTGAPQNFFGSFYTDHAINLHRDKRRYLFPHPAA